MAAGQLPVATETKRFMRSRKLDAMIETIIINTLFQYEKYYLLYLYKVLIVVVIT